MYGNDIFNRKTIFAYTKKTVNFIIAWGYVMTRCKGWTGKAGIPGETIVYYLVTDNSLTGNVLNP